MDTLSSASIIVAFIAGVAALFAPCCITVLLPSYLGSVFKGRYKVFLAAFVFFLGILTVFLPIGLGVSALSQIFNRYHNVIFTAGGLMLAVLGLSLIFGKRFSFHSPVHLSIKEKSIIPIYLLGIFSAIATTCCAPVLAGVLALSAAGSNIFWGGVYALSYVLGMVEPLFIIAIFLDKFDFTHKFLTLRKVRTIEVLGFKWRFMILELIAGIVFLAIGAYIIYLALSNRLLMQSDYQLTVNLYISRFTRTIQNFTQKVPETVWGILVIAIFSLIVYYGIKLLSKKDER